MGKTEVIAVGSFTGRCLLLGTLALFLAACNGGSGAGGSSGLIYSGVTTAAVITSTNNQDFVDSSTEGAAMVVTEEVVDEYTSPIGVGADKRASMSMARVVLDIVREISAEDPALSNIPAGATTTVTWSQLNTELGDAYFCGGNVSVTSSSGGDKGSMEFNNLCMNDIGDLLPDISMMTINGKFVWQATATTYSSTGHFTLSAGGETFTFDGETSCTGSAYSYDSCSYAGLYTGSDGQIYKLVDYDVSTPDGGTSWNIDARFYHPEHGHVDISTNVALEFSCSNGMPGAGEIRIDGAGGSYLIITYVDCNTWSGTYHDGASSIGIGGTWP